MKYTLNEDIRHILEERFILNEALSTKDLKNLKNNLEKIKNDGSKLSKASKQNEETLSKLKTQIYALSKTVQKTKDINIVKGNTLRVIKSVEDLLTVADPSFAAKKSAFNKAFNDVKTLAGSSSVDKATLTNLKKSIEELNIALDLALDQTKTDNKTSSNSIEHLAQTIACLNSLIDISGTGVPTDFEKPINLIQGAYDGYDKDKNETALNYLITVCAKENKEITDLLTKAGAKAPSAAEVIDWDKRFKDAKDKNLFWEDYFKEVWGPNANRVSNLGIAFKNQCEKLGFTSKTNPFITFIKNYLVNKSYDIKADAYTAIHNAVAHNKIDLKQINSTSDSTQLNILCCKDLYSKSGKDVEEYINNLLEIKKINLTDLDENKFETDEAKQEFKSFDSHFESGDKKIALMWAILFNKYSLADLLTKVSKSNIKAPDINAIENTELRALTEIQKLMSVINANGAIGGPAGNFDDAAINLLVKRIIDVAGGSINVAAKWLSVILNVFLLPADSDSIKGKWKTISSATLTDKDMSDIKKELFTFGREMTKAKVEKVLTNLATAGLDLH